MSTKNIKRTMKVAHVVQETHEGDEIVKPGELVDVRYTSGQSPSLAARRTLALLIGVASANAWKNERHRITKAEIRQGHKSNDRISPLLDEVAGIRYKVETISSRGRAAIERAGLFEECIEESDDGDDSWIEFKFSASARRLFGDSGQYAQINRGALFSFESKYSVTLYELGCLYSGRKIPVWKGDFEKLRETLGLEKGKLKAWSDFRRKVLEQAQKEINQLAHFTIEWEEVRQNRKLIQINLKFINKLPEEINAAAEEVERPKVGRKARREDSAELIAENRKAIGLEIKDSLANAGPVTEIDDDIPEF